MKRPILKAKDVKALHEETRLYGYYKNTRFYSRWCSLWHNFYGQSVKEPWEDFHTIYTASCHTFYYRNRKKALAMEKRNRYYERINLNSRYGFKFSGSLALMRMNRAYRSMEEIDA
jgi:hypothetical protein